MSIKSYTIDTNFFFRVHATQYSHVSEVNSILQIELRGRGFETDSPHM